MSFPTNNDASGAFAYPCSSAQARLWFVDQYHPRNSAYNVSCTIPGKPIFEKNSCDLVMGYIVRRHDAFRTTFRSQDGIPEQIVCDRAEVNIAVAEVDEGAHHEAIRKFCDVPFDLEKGPLIRAILLKGSTTDMLCFCFHHIIIDGWSIEVFKTEFQTAYRQVCNGETINLSAVPFQYVDYVQWQRELVAAEYSQKRVSNAVSHLRGAPALLELPCDKPRTKDRSLRGASQSFVISAETTAGLRVLAGLENATMFMAIMAAFATLLSRYAGQRDFVVASPISGRTRSEFESTIGCFLNNVLFRFQFDAACRYRDILRKVRDIAINAYSIQDIPVEIILEQLQPERNGAFNPVYQTMYVHQNVPASDYVESTERATNYTIGQPVAGTAKLDLSLSTAELGREIVGCFEYSTDLFEHGTIRCFIECFLRLLDSITEDPEVPWESLEILNQDWRNRIVFAWNDTTRRYSEQSICGLFQKQAALTPGNIALRHHEVTISYFALDTWSNRLSQALLVRGIRDGAIVGLWLDHSPEMVALMLAVLKIGAAYLPLDPTMPTVRVEFVVKDAGISLLVAERPQLNRVTGDVAMVEIQQLLREQETQTEKAPERAVHCDSLAYVIYTSGSTGRPKGVMTMHRAVVDRLEWMLHEYRVVSEDRFLLKHPLTFDVSVWELFLPLISGGSVVLLLKEDQKDTYAVLQFMLQHKVTIGCFLPSMLELMLTEKGVEKLNEHLRLMLCGAEAMNGQLPARFYSKLTAELQNLYGPTETCIHVTYWPCPRVSGYLDVVPIGKPMGNVRIYILDDICEPVPPMVKGEIYIAGDGVSPGYINNPRATKLRFVQESFVKNPTAKMYATGDIAYFLGDGNVVFVGRKDQQLKVRGFRVETAEVVNVILQHPQVRNVVIKPREDNGVVTSLIAYVVLRDPSFGMEALSLFVSERLPDYMVPSIFVPIERLPTNENDKIDFNALPSPGDYLSARSETESVRTQLEREIEEIWKSILRLERIGLHDDFFHLGGHSLLATQVASRIRSLLGIRLSVRDLFENRTIASLARHIEQVRSLGETDTHLPQKVR